MPLEAAPVPAPGAPQQEDTPQRQRRASGRGPRMWPSAQGPEEEPGVHPDAQTDPPGRHGAPGRRETRRRGPSPGPPAGGVDGCRRCRWGGRGVLHIQGHPVLEAIPPSPGRLPRSWPRPLGPCASCSPQPWLRPPTRLALLLRAGTSSQKINPLQFKSLPQNFQRSSVFWIMSVSFK